MAYHNWVDLLLGLSKGGQVGVQGVAVHHRLHCTLVLHVVAAHKDPAKAGVAGYCWPGSPGFQQFCPTCHPLQSVLEACRVKQHIQRKNPMMPKSLDKPAVVFFRLYMDPSCLIDLRIRMMLSA